ncbi:(2Fe-2S)-binding protein [Sphingomonas baiyangensis]|uniref:(2Fe-2S)-binding protein n=1 Tax=Sphingomonas baiyangensis TaxID=2572576 RepID=A0A4U1L2P6_9SPHN|nr:(2Fe-2S)-binding protein [Sphingomonas baiyangensis]TKD50754.1 (2Fe-2S)-binding protein [Sphingomonas baiyangensis]
MRRVEAGVTRGQRVAFTIDGASVTAFKGETVLAAARAADMPIAGWCNMGSCGECMVTAASGMRVRACLTPVAEGLSVTTHG